MNHEIEIITINDKPVEIDKKLVKVIEELNKVGLKTRHCCEGNNTSSGIKAYVSIEASPGVIFEFKENRLIIRWILI